MTWLLLVPECYFRCYHLYPHPGFCFLLWVHIDSLNQGVYVSQFGLPTYRQCKRTNFYFEIFILKLSLVNQIIANKKLIKSKRKKSISIHELGQESLSNNLSNSVFWLKNNLLPLTSKVPQCYHIILPYCRTTSGSLVSSTSNTLSTEIVSSFEPECNNWTTKAIIKYTSKTHCNFLYLKDKNITKI